MKLDIKKVLLLLVLIHLAAFALTACGKKDKNTNTTVACPAGVPTDVYGSCLYPGGSGVSGSATIAFYQNARIENGQRSNFRRMISNSMGGYGISCSDWGNSDCDALQIIIERNSDRIFTVYFKGLATNRQPYPVWTVYGGNNGSNRFQQTASQVGLFTAVAQTRQENGKTVVRFNRNEVNAYNPWGQAPYELSQNYLYLETDGLLSQDSINVSLYYVLNPSRRNPHAVTKVKLASGTLLKGRDYN